MNKLFAIFLFPLCLLAVNSTRAQDVPPKPNPATAVNDFAHVMTADQVSALEHKLQAYNDSTTTQIVIVTQPDIGDAAIEDYALKIMRSWGVGSKKNNNGIVILADIKDHKVYIAVGYGLEGAIPDATAKEIVDNEIIPNFRGGGDDNFYRGFDQAADALIKAAAGEYKAPAGSGRRVRHSRGSGGGFGFFIIIFIIIIVIISRRGGGGRGGGGGYYGGGGFLPFLLGTMVGRGLGDSGGGWGGGDSGGGGFDGGGGGGFDGGFGGGSGGGGGAGGSW